MVKVTETHTHKQLRCNAECQSKCRYTKDPHMLLVCFECEVFFTSVHQEESSRPTGTIFIVYIFHWCIPIYIIRYWHSSWAWIHSCCCLIFCMYWALFPPFHLARPYCLNQYAPPSSPPFGVCLVCFVVFNFNSNTLLARKVYINGYPYVWSLYSINFISSSQFNCAMHNFYGADVPLSECVCVCVLLPVNAIQSTNRYRCEYPVPMYATIRWMSFFYSSRFIPTLSKLWTAEMCALWHNICAARMCVCVCVESVSFYFMC